VAHVEIAESLLRLLEEGKVENLPVMDITVEAVRSCLRQGLSEFRRLAVATFAKVKSKRKASSLCRRFFKENRLRIAELVLSGQVEP